MANISDAYSLSWAPVEFGDGSGRGSFEDWLACGGWPDASSESPKVVAEGRRSWYLDGCEAVELPEPDRGHLAWPELWAKAGAAELMGLLRSQGRAPLARAACACARSALASLRERYAMAHDTTGDPLLRFTEAWAGGDIDAERLVRSAYAEALGAGWTFSAAPELRAAQVAFVADSDFARSAAQSVTDSSLLIIDVSGSAAEDVQRLLGDVVRGALPWHEVLTELVRQARRRPSGIVLHTTAASRPARGA